MGRISGFPELDWLRRFLSIKPIGQTIGRTSPEGMKFPGTTAQPRGRSSPAALSFIKTCCFGEVRPPRRYFAAVGRLKEE